MTLKLRKWDSAEYLKTDEDMILYLEACLEADDDAAFISKALGTIARITFTLWSQGDTADRGFA